MRNAKRNIKHPHRLSISKAMIGTATRASSILTILKLDTNEPREGKGM